MLIGISQFAVDELTDITYLEITAEGAIDKGDALGDRDMTANTGVGN